MNPRVPETEEIGDHEVTIRQHCRAEVVSLMPLRQLARPVRADGQDADLSLVELRPEFFPSPKFGDAVGSPVRAEELDEDQVPREAFRMENLAMFICRGERRNPVSDADRVRAELLSADGHRKEEDTRCPRAKEGRHAANPPRRSQQGSDAQRNRQEPGPDKRTPIVRNRYAADRAKPEEYSHQRHRQGGKTESYGHETSLCFIAQPESTARALFSGRMS